MFVDAFRWRNVGKARADGTKRLKADAVPTIFGINANIASDIALGAEVVIPAMDVGVLDNKENIDPSVAAHVVQEDFSNVEEPSQQCLQEVTDSDPSSTPPSSEGTMDVTLRQKLARCERLLAREHSRAQRFKKLYRRAERKLKMFNKSSETLSPEVAIINKLFNADQLHADFSWIE